MAKPNALQDVSPEKVETLLKRHGTQAKVARRLGVTQASLSRYMRNHGFRKVERWERAQ